MSYRQIYFLLFVIAFFQLAGCNGNSSSQHKNISWQAQSLAPEMARIYQTTCKNCHENSATGAPQTGDTNAWNKVLEPGLDASIERVINGFGGMPPAGQCFECTPEHFASLIRYMSKPSSNQEQGH